MATLNIGGDSIPLDDMEDQEDVLHSKDYTYQMLDAQIELIEEESQSN